MTDELVSEIIDLYFSERVQHVPTGHVYRKRERLQYSLREIAEMYGVSHMAVHRAVAKHYAKARGE